MEYSVVLKKNLEAIPGKHSVDSLQKITILGTSHIIWKVLQFETCSLDGWYRQWFKRRSIREKLPVTRDDNDNDNNNNNNAPGSKSGHTEHLFLPMPLS